MKKILQKILVAGVTVGSLIFTPQIYNSNLVSTVQAEIKTYDGEGQYIMSDFENFEIAKQRARARAEQSAKDKAGVYLSQYSVSENFNLTKNEISAITNNILNIVGKVEYDQKISTVKDMPVVIHIAKLKANIDTDGIKNWLNLDAEERNKIIAQNIEIEKVSAENNNRIENLKLQYNNATSQVEKDKIRAELDSLDKEFLAIQKFAEGNKFYSVGDYQAAINLYNETLQLNPNFADAYNNLGVIYNQLKNYQVAIDNYTKALEINPNNALFYYNLGANYFSLKNYDAALQNYNKSIELDPNFAFAYNNRGNVYQNLNDFEKAMADFKKAIELETNYANNATVYNNIGMIYDELKQYENAIENFKKAVALDPLHAVAYRNLAGTYEKVENSTEALKNYNKAIELNPNYADAFNNRGTLYGKLKDYQKALEDFDKSIALNPDSAVTYENRCLVLTKLQEYPHALEDIDAAIKLSPNNARFYKSRGKIYSKLNDHEKAVADYSKAIELGLNDFLTYFSRALSYYNLKNYNAAISDCDSALKFEQDGGIYKLRGLCYGRLGETEKANADFAKAKELGWKG